MWLTTFWLKSIMKILFQPQKRVIYQILEKYPKQKQIIIKSREHAFQNN